ncbi:MAG TPA: hypothetical protein VIS99_07375 [Terrimicrobiaceae bacterium]
MSASFSKTDLVRFLTLRAQEFAAAMSLKERKDGFGRSPLGGDEDHA